ncbi:unnamed protein product [Arctia plantaginis]|uniref:Uncharacterized protein n=1 Tax=Arctia plantaginis TaxID=874455 RepID=A0A8S1A829_ARCPL|nr:unnamed protein product [Arctia plantaginis]
MKRDLSFIFLESSTLSSDGSITQIRVPYVEIRIFFQNNFVCRHRVTETVGRAWLCRCLGAPAVAAVMSLVTPAHHRRRCDAEDSYPAAIAVLFILSVAQVFSQHNQQ